MGDGFLGASIARLVGKMRAFDGTLSKHQLIIAGGAKVWFALVCGAWVYQAVVDVSCNRDSKFFVHSVIPYSECDSNDIFV